MIDYCHSIVLKTLLHRENIKKKVLYELTWHEIFVCSICIVLCFLVLNSYNKILIEIDFRMISITQTSSLIILDIMLILIQ